MSETQSDLSTEGQPENDMEWHVSEGRTGDNKPFFYAYCDALENADTKEAAEKFAAKMNILCDGSALRCLEREHTQLKAAVKKRGLAVQMIDGEMVLLKTARAIIAECTESEQLKADLMTWQRYASYLKSCAKSGEFEPQEFDEFVKEFATKLLHAIQNVDTPEVENDG